MATSQPNGAGLVLTYEQRGILYSQAMLDLTGIGDIWLTIERGEMDDARAYRRQYEDDMRLLDDLGREEIDLRDAYPVTMPLEQLERVVQRFLDLAEKSLAATKFEPSGVIAGYHLSEEEMAEERAGRRLTADEDLDVRSVCLAILRQLHTGAQ